MTEVGTEPAVIADLFQSWREVAVHFEPAVEQENLCIRLNGKLFTYKKEEFKAGSLGLVEALATHAGKISWLELGNFIFDGTEYSPSLAEVMKTLGDKGMWSLSLKSLMIRFWSLDSTDQFSQVWLNVPASLTELRYQSGPNDNVSATVGHLNTFVKQLPNLESLNVSAYFAPIESKDPLALDRLVVGIDQTCPKLKLLSVVYDVGNRTPVDNVTKICSIVLNLQMLKDLCLFDKLTADAMEKVSEACRSKNVSLSHPGF